MAITFFPLFFLLFFSSRLQEGVITGLLNESSIISVDKIVSVVLSNKIFQRNNRHSIIIVDKIVRN